MIADILFPVADQRRTAFSLLQWWEARRLMFNAFVGGAGLFTLLIVRLIAWLPPGVRFELDWRPVVAYALLANVCYTFGWASEAVAQRIWKDQCPRFGPALFRQGLVFSAGLTLLPILLVSFTWVMRTVWLLVR
jgi:hypothetical protein